MLVICAACDEQGKDATKHLFGVSFNYDKVCGCVEPEEKDPIKYNNTYLQRFDRSVVPISLATARPRCKLGS